jgi:SAM-dependent methyltransferase
VTVAVGLLRFASLLPLVLRHFGHRNCPSLQHPERGQALTFDELLHGLPGNTQFSGGLGYCQKRVAHFGALCAFCSCKVNWKIILTFSLTSAKAWIRLPSMMTASHNWEIFDKSMLLNREPFDRKVFNPATSDVDKRSLDTLRTQGRTRSYNYQTYFHSPHHESDHIRCCGSTALRNLNLTRAKRGDRFLDLGCGDSPDALIAKNLGYSVFAFDLFLSQLPPETFIQRDIVEDWPQSENEQIAVVSCQAMIDLVAPDEREKLYRNVLKALRPDGLFSLYGVNLHCGHGFNNHVEIARVRKIGFRAVDVKTNGFVVIK